MSRWILLLLLPACGDGFNDPPQPESGFPDTDTAVLVETEDTGLPPGLDEGVGSIVLRGGLTSTSVRAVFVTDDAGIRNLAGCHPVGNLGCYDSEPADFDDWVEPVAGFDDADVNYYDLGERMLLGELYPLRRLRQGLVTYYVGSQNFAPPIGGTLDLRLLPGDWGPSNGNAEVLVPSSVELLEPGQNIDLAPGKVIPFRWQPGGRAAVGEVFLQVRSVSLGLDRLYVLEDDGEFLLDVADLGSIRAGDELTFAFGRRVVRDRVVKNHRVTIESRVDQNLDGIGIDVDGRTFIELPDDCTASPTVPLPIDRYYGFLETYQDDYNPGITGCTGVETPGPDAVARVVVPAGEELTANLLIDDDSSALYVLTDACDTDTCIEADQGFGNRTVRFGNPTDQPIELALIVDATDTIGASLYFLDLSTEPIDNLVVPPESCEDAQLITPYEPSSITLAVGGYDDDHDGAACGVEGKDDVVLPVEVPAHSSVRVVVDSHTSAYVLEACDEDCRVPNETGGTEYLNPDDTARTVFFVLEDRLGLSQIQQVFISTEPHDSILSVDTCAEAEATAPLEDGTYVLQPGIQDDHIDAGTACTGFDTSGGDVVVPLVVEPDQRLRVGSTPDVQLYLLSDCNQPRSSCVDGVGGSPLLYYNDSGVAQNLFLVMESGADSSIVELTIDREFVFLADSADVCDDIDTIEPITRSGTYEGTLAGATNALDPGNSSCTSFAAAYGDRIMPIIVPPHTELYTWISDTDQELYILDACAQDADCKDGSAEDFAAPNGTEDAFWINYSDEPVEMFVVVDANYSSAEDVFDLHVEFLEPVLLEVMDSCASALVDPAPVGVSRLDLTDFDNDLDPSCISSGQYRDALVPLTLESGELVTIEADELTKYILLDCDPNTCVASTTADVVTYLNEDSVPVDVWLGLEAKHDRPRGRDVILTSRQVNVAVTADTYTDALVLPPTAEGVWMGNLANATSTLNPSTISCGTSASYEEDFLRVDVPADSQLRVRLVDGETDKELYLLSADGASTCMGASDGPLGPEGGEEVRWLNTSGATVSVVVAVDNDTSSSDDIYELGVQFVPVDPIDVADSCAEAGSLPSVQPGTYVVDRTGSNTLDPTCTSETDDHEAMLPVTLDVGEGLQFEADGTDALYFLTDCTDPTTCTERDTDSAQRPLLKVANTGITPLSGFVVMDGDATPQTGEDRELVLTVHALEVLSMVDACPDTGSLTPITTGEYRFYGDTSNFNDDIDPGPNGCTGYDARGSEGIALVRLENGESIEVVFDGEPNYDGAFYLLEDCTSTQTCVVGTDIPEFFTYVNNSGITKTYFLVIDGWAANDQGTFDLTVNIGSLQ